MLWFFDIFYPMETNPDFADYIDMERTAFNILIYYYKFC